MGKKMIECFANDAVLVGGHLGNRDTGGRS
jgi:hypothetical protein